MADGALKPQVAGAAETQCRRLRADAARNREAVLTAAREVFAEHGLGAPLEEIARRARVGIGTLYRRFPTREQLVSAALIGKISQYAVAAEQALAEPDPWAGFTGFVRQICAMQAGDRGLADLLLITLAPGEELEAIRDRANRALIRLIDRAKDAGQLRTDMVGEDLLLMLIGNSAIAAAAGRDAPRALPRFVALMLDAFRPRPGAELPRPPSTAQMRRVMSQLATEHGCGQP
ncbi:MAG TPA: helix-turn-helix domain-containing protein [Streptosporangiaceae bacterium]